MKFRVRVDVPAIRVLPALVIAATVTGVFPWSPGRVLGQQTEKTGERRAAYVLPPASTRDRERLERAASWLVDHIAQGDFHPRNVNHGSGEGISASELQSLSIIAWKDPTLRPHDPNALAGYLTTDTLWAAVALQQLSPAESKSLSRTLQALNAVEHGLHGVLFGPMPQICHRPIDQDPVHGKSIGRILLDQPEWVDVRAFTMKQDDGFTRGHPRLFAEHTAYQALFEFWQGQTDAAKRRLREISLGDAQHPGRQHPGDLSVVWDRKRQLLIDAGNHSEWKRIPETTQISQFPIKLGTVLYALRLTGLDREFPEAARAMQTRLWQAQRPDGGVAHRITVSLNGETLDRSGATGEATAITILARTVQTP